MLSGKDKLPKREGFTYSWDDDFYGYQLMDGGQCYYIEGRDGDMLIGDQLPSTLAEAKIYCRCANMAYNHAKQKITEEITSDIVDLVNIWKRS